MQILLSSDINVKEVGEKRTFHGIANSGKPFNYQGKMAIVDLSSISYHDKLPALVLHDRAKRAGFGTLSVKDNQLLITGELLANADGQEIAKDADAGFPWQLSAHVSAKRIDKLTGNQTAIVNGQTVKAPMMILRDSHISEISFTPTGVDNQTVAHVLSDNHKDNTMTDTNILELSEKVADLTKQNSDKDERIKALEAEKTALESENTKLKDEKEKAETEAKKADVEARLSAKGFKKDDKGNWQGIDSATLDVLLSLDSDKAKAVIGNLSAPKKDVPEFLLGETYGGTQDNQSTGNPLVDDAIARSKQPAYV